MGSLERKNPRVPMAWKHRDMSFHGGPRRSSSPSDTSSDEVAVARQPYRPLEERLDHYTTIRSARSDSKSPLMMDFPFRGSGTLRSTRSVPALAFAMDPCPIHGGGGPMRRHGSLFDMRSPPHMNGMDKKNFYGPPPPHFQYHPEFMPPPHMMNPMMRPPHQVRMPLIMESIPVRDPFNKGLPYHRNVVNTKEPIDPYSVEQVCCKGHLIVLWIILGVVTVGVVLGIIMGVTIT